MGEDPRQLLVDEGIVGLRKAMHRRTTKIVTGTPVNIGTLGGNGYRVFLGLIINRASLLATLLDI